MTTTGDAAKPMAGGRSTRAGQALMGALMIVVGIFCMVVPKISGKASVVIFGALLALSGLIELVGGGQVRGRTRGPLMGGGLFSLAVGLVMMARPLAGMAALTLLLAVFFFAAGVFPLVSGLSDREEGWAWEVTFGVIAILVGVMVLLRWPVSSLWLVGTLVGIEIVLRGATLMAASFSLSPPGRMPSVRPA